ncbi:MAG TPA: isochorismate synthase [Acidimicrobiales bacterium]|nr:isochorismate synthase [Acidimicrobiales bacterium]
MKFVRSRIAPLRAETLRALGARDGWLVESPEVLRAGFGRVVDRVELSAGLHSPTDATAALQRHEIRGEEGPAGTGLVAFATLPFDRNAPGELQVPEFLITQGASGESWLTSLDGSNDWRHYVDAVTDPVQETQSLRSLTYQPTPEEYAHNVALAVEILRRKEIDKVVLARAVLGSVPDPIDAAAIVQRLRLREPICTLYSLPASDGQRFVGASPELLVRRTGAEILCHPLAGTITLPPNVAPDDYQTWLLGSTKNLHEYGVLVDEVVRTLANVYDDVYADPEPSIVTLRTVAHLGAWVSARSNDLATAPDALEVLRMLHPTAAVGGVPRESAYELICRLEQHDRGHYAGPVGWMDARGDGEWWIGIRGVLVKGRAFEAWAGAGIVSESDPIAEREETRDKLASVLTSVLVDRV